MSTRLWTSTIGNLQVSFSRTMLLTKDLCKVWHLCPDNKAKSIVVLRVSFFSVSFWGVRYSDECFRTILTSQMLLYFGKEGFSSNTPFTNRHTKGCVPNWLPSGNITTEDSALLAVLMALYPILESNSTARKLMPSSSEGCKGSMPLAVQWRFHSWR